MPTLGSAALEHLFDAAIYRVSSGSSYTNSLLENLEGVGGCVTGYP
jgi:hypothetical protein